MRAWLSLSATLGGRERLFERRELAAHGGDLLVEDLDLAQRPAGGLLFGFERGGEFARLGLGGAARIRAGPAAAPARPRWREAWSCRGARFSSSVRPARALQGQEIGQLGDLAVEPVEHRVAARDSRDRKNWPTMKIEIRKMMASSSVDRASTKPGQ